MVYYPLFISFWVNVSSRSFRIYVITRRNSTDNAYITCMITILLFLIIVISPWCDNIFAISSTHSSSIGIFLHMWTFHCFPISWACTICGIITFLLIVSSPLAIIIGYSSKLCAFCEFVFVSSAFYVIHSYSAVRHILACSILWTGGVFYGIIGLLFKPCVDPLTTLDVGHIVWIVFN